MAPALVEREAAGTVGVHPKVALPALGGVMAFVVLLVLGYDDTAVTVLLAAVGYGGIGVASPAGRVKVRR